ncbi:zinc finger protein 91-like [Armigeres subalbatus]|uniref:zinc finger protein 91-like n=1 Tax=Armigeres subalbatus TaxID=124917 RepID=UPI002ED0DC46
MASSIVKIECEDFRISHSICRLCMGNELLDDIFKENDLHQWISDFLSITVSPEDQRSQSICAICRKRITEFHQFRVRCRDVQNVLESMAQNANVESVQFRRQRIWEENLCKYCGKSFSKRQHLDKHMLIHEEMDRNELIIEQTNEQCDINEDVVNHKDRASNNLYLPHNVEADHDEAPDSEDSIVLEDMIDISEVKVENRADDDTQAFQESSAPLSKASFGWSNVDGSKDQTSKDSGEEVQDKESFQCNICNKMLTSGRTLWGHIRAVHGPKNHVCRICKIGFPFQKELKKHYATIKHRNKIQEIRDNGESYDEDDGDDAVQNQEEIDTAFDDSVRLKKLVPTDENYQQYSCSKCSRTFIYESHLEKHFKSHEEDDVYTAEGSDNSGNGSAEGKHTKNSDRQLKCKICNRLYPNLRKLKQHRRCHDTKTHRCPMCEKLFLTRSILRKHVVTHKQVRERKQESPVAVEDNSAEPFKCDICHKTFKRMSTMQGHKKIAHGPDVHECKTCGEEFRTSAGLEFHKLNHSIIKKMPS